jgi:hypothetical protein
MLAMTDRDGVVEASVPGLADAARVTTPECMEALERLSSPDPHSRTPDNEGRRIEKVTGGWSILNYEAYRERASEEERRRKNAERQARWRERHSTTENIQDECPKSNAPLHTVTHRNAVLHHVAPNNPIAEAEAEAGSPTSLRSVDHMGVVVTSGDQETLSSQLNVFTPEDIKKRSSKKTNEKSKGSIVWDAYSEAYKHRYGAEPVRNAKANSLCARLCALLPAEDAPAVASHYLTTRANPYAQSGHCLDLLVRDAQKIYTEWKTGHRVTQSQSREGDRLQGQGDVWRNVEAKMRKEGRIEE